ncbi:MAG TPA: transporter [Acidobacteriaceae bacterium]
MHWNLRHLLLIAVCAFWTATLCSAQMPFYTDDPGVTENRVLHFEFYNEFDGLQSSQYPALNQNTANFKVNYGLPHNLELDLDAPYIDIHRSQGSTASAGMGDTDLGLKWHIVDSDRKSHRPALATSFYVEFPTGNVQEQLGSGLRDYWLNMVAQEPLGEKTRITANFGYLFAGNTSTGVIGVQTTTGHVYTAGLSLVRDFTSRLTLGAEAYGGLADTNGLGKDQLQFLAGGSYRLHGAVSATFAVLGGRYEASPRIGGQLGFAVDFPAFGHKKSDAKK